MKSNSQPQTSSFFLEEGMNVSYEKWSATNNPKAIVVFAYGISLFIDIKNQIKPNLLNTRQFTCGVSELNYNVIENSIVLQKQAFELYLDIGYLFSFYVTLFLST